MYGTGCRRQRGKKEGFVKKAGKGAAAPGSAQKTDWRVSIFLVFWLPNASRQRISADSRDVACNVLTEVFSEWYVLVMNLFTLDFHDDDVFGTASVFDAGGGRCMQRPYWPPVGCCLARKTVFCARQQLKKT
jgi:hypothetical protein